MAFLLHETLSKDTIFVAQWPINSILLMNDANFPWLILVPHYQGLIDFHDVPQKIEVAFVKEINHAARTLKSITQAKKINTAALGNVVPQLHVHVIARFEADPAWPNPVWGQCIATPYSKNNAALFITQFLTAADQVACR